MEESFKLLEKAFCKEAERIHQLQFVKKFKQETGVKFTAYIKRLYWTQRGDPRSRLVDMGYESETETEVEIAPIFREGSYRTPAMVDFRGGLIEQLEDWINDYLVSIEGSPLRRQLRLRNAWLNYQFEVEFEKM